MPRAFPPGRTASSRELSDLLAQFRPRPLDVAALPPELRRHYRQRRRRLRPLHQPEGDLWNRENLEPIRARRRVARVATPARTAPVVTGIAPNIYHSTRAIETSFYQATAYALALILMLVLIDLRRVGQTLLAVSVLALGLPMLVGADGAVAASTGTSPTSSPCRS